MPPAPTVQILFQSSCFWGIARYCSGQSLLLLLDCDIIETFSRLLSSIVLQWFTKRKSGCKPSVAGKSNLLSLVPGIWNSARDLNSQQGWGICGCTDAGVKLPWFLTIVQAGWAWWELVSNSIWRKAHSPTLIPRCHLAIMANRYW